MAHTYLFEEGAWEVSGRYIDAEGTPAPLEGVFRISHTPQAWLSIGQMKVLLDEPITFENRYTFAPLAVEQSEAQWSSIHPALGRLSGLLVVVGDALLLTWQSEKGNGFGMEYLQQTEIDRYIDRGTMFANDRRVSSWMAELVRIT